MEVGVQLTPPSAFMSKCAVRMCSISGNIMAHWGQSATPWRLVSTSLPGLPAIQCHIAVTTTGGLKPVQKFAEAYGVFAGWLAVAPGLLNRQQSEDAGNRTAAQVICSRHRGIQRRYADREHYTFCYFSAVSSSKMACCK